MENSASEQHLGRLFDACDLDGSGYIDQEELASICSELSVDELADVFKQLDKDGDGRISIDEFAKGYREIAIASAGRKREMIRQRLRSEKSEEDKIGDEDVEYVGGLDEGLKALSCQEQVCELYQSLHGVDKPELVTQFENILLNVLKDVRQYQLENERLEKTYKHEKEAHDKHLRRLEEEMEQQVQSIEERVRKQVTEKKKEKERLESEKLELRNQLDAEIVMLQQNLKKLQQDGENKLDKGQEDHLMAMKKRLEEIYSENRMLKSDLTDAQTNLALVKSQMTSVKQKLDEKTYELEIENKQVQDLAAEQENLRRQLQMLYENKAMEDYATEQENLRRQLQMLHEANKNLLDTNDNLREILDTNSPTAPAFKRTASTDFELGALYKSGASGRSGHLSPSFPRKGSVMSDYIDAPSPGNRPLLHTFAEEAGMMPRFLSLQQLARCTDNEHIPEDLGDHHVFLSPDSGHSTLRDINDIPDDVDIDSVSVQSSEVRRGRRHRRMKPSLRLQEEDEPDSHDETDTDDDMKGPEMPSFHLPAIDHKRSPSIGSRGSNRSNRSNRSLTREESVFSQSSRSSKGSTRRQLPVPPAREAVIARPITLQKDPDRMYKIVLAGDAAVGKSSFIVRLCKGKFVPNLSSTLGVDFQTKMLDVDGQTTALQLWDTAGQERFRSVARTYFRRADGVLLLYDVTYERSFLNIRDWVATIERDSQESALKKIPIMLVGNKTDARAELEYQGRRVVKHEDGVRLSKELDALFIETSAKDGSHIPEAVIELTRLLRTNEDMEVKAVGMQLRDEREKKTGNCCRRS